MTSTPPRTSAAPMCPWYLYQPVKSHWENEERLGVHIPEEHLLQHGHGSDNSRLSPCCQCMHLNVGGDEGSCKFCVCSSSCTTAADVVRDEMDLNNGARSSEGIG